MEDIQKKLLRALRKSYEFVADVVDLPGTEDPLIIHPYRGYASPRRIYLRGRVLEDEEVLVRKSHSEIENLLNSFKRFESDEAPGVNVCFRFDEQEWELITDEEGYFTIDEPLEESLDLQEERWLKGEVILPGLPSTTEDDIRAQADILFPDPGAEFGIITDIDDTVLQTHITSLFRLRMLYVTLFQNVHQRLPMEGVPELLQGLTRGSDGYRRNPVFYVSNSPWNIYDLLEEFLDLEKLPKGPIFLRDIDPFKRNRPEEYRGHKMETISTILEHFPNMKFLMLGDTGSKDADVYLELARQFPEQVLDIYIRNTKETSNARRVTELVKGAKDVSITMIRSSSEIVKDVLQKGYMKKIKMPAPGPSGSE